MTLPRHIWYFCPSGTMQGDVWFAITRADRVNKVRMEQTVVVGASGHC